MKKFTVCLYPGSGIELAAIEVKAEELEEALKKACVKLLDGIKEWNYSHFLIEIDTKEFEEILEFYKKEYEEYKRKYEEDDSIIFMEEFLEMKYLDLTEYKKRCYMIKSFEHCTIEEGWDLYNNSIKEEKI